MKIALLFTLITLVSCGRTHNKSAPVVEQNVSINNKFHSAAGLHGINDINFSDFALNVPVDVSSQCSGTSYGNSGLVGGVSEGYAELQGDENEGILQYGHLPYLNPLDSLCRELSKESYTYKITGKNLKLCMVNYPFCADYTIVE
jgi:hypothetical protein